MASNIDTAEVIDRANHLIRDMISSIKVTGGYGVTVSGTFPSFVITSGTDGGESPDPEKLLFNVCHLGSPGTQMVAADAAEVLEEEP